MTEVAGRIAVVTGGASGIGLGIAEAFSAAGAHLVIADLSLDAALPVADRLGAFAVQVDVADPDSVAGLRDATLSHYGAVDIVVNNAGVGPQATIAEMTLDDWRWLLDVNLWGVIHGVHAFLPLLVDRPEGGHIVNVSSMSAFAPMSPLGGYAVTKAGVTALTEVLAQELLESGSLVRATVVAPGPTRTLITESLRHRPVSDTGGLREFSNAPPQNLWRSSAQVGGTVLDAVLSNALYAITHAELLARVAQRHARIEAAFRTAL